MSLGGGLVNPHSYSGRYSLEEGFHFMVSLEENLAENDRWGLSGGVLFMAFDYERHDNYAPYKKTGQSTHTLAFYVKPWWTLTEEIKLFTLHGLGNNFGDNFEPCLLLGGGAGYTFTENWSLEASYIRSWDSVKAFGLSTLSIRYEF